ncbi:hypothetical protein KIM372_16030 [Bombiscardovia nodaiensis]|uniref:Transcriptional regulator LacI/GalR-like sensor domain-containing protein n=1 Tax=Bombiscardovia nodaiensis TaxID=2932181 RepID=A0ABM8BAA8_9BIFI|nr:hypothetical protein KIM372_16030 [Bombiscardovia nodaiensis]
MNDTAALGVMRALVDRHIRIPQDVSVIGFDGINQGAFTSPSLTTMDFDFDDMAQQAVDMLMLRLHEMNAEDSEKQPPQHLLAHYRLLKRESTR